MRAIVVNNHGGPEELRLADIPDPVAHDDDILVAVEYAGINYIDTYFRDGTYPIDTPFTPGLEGVGRVVYDPQSVIAESTLVAWCDAPGSYAERVVVPRDRIASVPTGIAGPVAASMLLQGITAHYLIDGVFRVDSTTTLLLTGGAGGVGLIATQLAKSLGATVFSIVSSDEKREAALEAGADEVFFYGPRLVSDVREATNGRGVDVVYDGVGKDTFHQSLQVLRPRGTLCLFGAASGPVEPFDPQLLNQHGSLFLTRPSIAAYTRDADEFRRRAQAVTQAIVAGDLSIHIGGVYPLANAAQAHRDLQARATMGSLVLQITGD